MIFSKDEGEKKGIKGIKAKQGEKEKETQGNKSFQVEQVGK